jgi:hypothetical protein
MKKYFAICFLIILFSCSSDSSTEMKTIQFEGKVCEACPLVRISIPEADDKTVLGGSVNRAIREEIFELLDFDQERKIDDIPGAIEAFQMGYQNLQKEFPEELTGWEASVEGTKSYEDPSLLTIKLNTYLFTGGAHGYGATTYLNFDKKTGEEIEGSELLKKPEDFLKFAEKVFRKKYDIPLDAPINSTGFMFEANRFILPKNIGLTAENIVLHYNPYEAASYADGALILEIPLEEGLSYLSKVGN